MFGADRDSYKVRVSLHPFDFPGISLESMMRHAFMNRGINVDTHTCSDFELLQRSC